MGETGTPAPAADRPREPWGSWSTLFQHCADPVFLLSRRRQLRFANRAWEAITGRTFEGLRGAFCLPRKKTGTGPVRAVLQTLAPPPEVIEGRTVTVRRPVPPARVGPPWWDLTFVPLRDADGLTGILGFIRSEGIAPESKSHAGLTEGLVALRQQAAGRFTYDLLQSESAAMQRVESQARLAASLPTPIWIAGEAGTGKETLARIIHFQGATRERMFLGVDCLGLQPFLLKSMIFGPSTPTGVRVGTVYLKDPAALPRDLQSELLDWLEEEGEPPRIIAGSRDLTGADQGSGRLLPEFSAALNVFEIRLPPLRERPADLPRLVTQLLKREAREGDAPPEVAAEVQPVLARHAWPGNLRELAAVLRDALASSGGKRIDAGHLPFYLRVRPPATDATAVPKLDDVLEEVEARLIKLTLRRTKGNRSEAADLLGIPRARLIRRIEVLKIDDPA